MSNADSIQHELRRVLDAQTLNAMRPAITQLAELIARYSDKAISYEELTNQIKSDTPLATLVSSLVNKQIETNDSVITFGQSNQMGDVSIHGDVARQIINIHISEKQPAALFSSHSPFPRGYDVIKPGTRLSVVLNVYPRKTYELSFTSIGYSISLQEGLFRGIGFSFDSSKEPADPMINAVHYLFRDVASCEYIRSQAFEAFGLSNAITELAGSVVVWKNINGYRLRLEENIASISDNGSISKVSKKWKWFTW